MAFIPFKKFRTARWHRIERKMLLKKMNSQQELKVILGAGFTEYDGWVKTDYPFFDITNEKHWNYFFDTKKPSKLLCEHVLEHFTDTDVNAILKLAFQHLELNGNIRIAVPDKKHPNPAYIEYVRPGGSGWGADDHRSFWNNDSMGDLLNKIGFEVSLLEYYNDEKKLITSKFDLDNGEINRSHAYGFKNEIENYSSLIIDAKKAKTSQ